MFCSQNFFFFFRCHICIYLCCRYRCMPQHFFVYIEYLHPLPSNMLQMNVETYVVLYSYLLLSHAHIYVSYFWLIAQITYSPITHKKSATKCCPFYSGFFSIYYSFSTRYDGTNRFTTTFICGSSSYAVFFKSLRCSKNSS